MGDPGYSREDTKAMFYVYSILGVIITVCCYFCVQYNDKQVAKKLEADGITVYCRIDSVSEESTGKGSLYFINVDYTSLSINHKLTLKVNEAEFKSAKYDDTLILRRLADNAPSFMKILGFRNRGVDYVNKFRK